MQCINEFPTGLQGIKISNMDIFETLEKTSKMQSTQECTCRAFTLILFKSAVNILVDMHSPNETR